MSAAHQTRDVEPMLIQCCITVCDAGRAYILFKKLAQHLIFARLL